MNGRKGSRGWKRQGKEKKYLGIITQEGRAAGRFTLRKF